MLLIVAGAALLLAGSWLWVSRWTKARHLLDTPTSRIRSAAQGYVELSGMLDELADAPAMLAPLTSKPCLWWRYRIEEHIAGDKRRGWRVIDQGRSDRLLRLVDATGECLIDPEGAEVLPARREVWSGPLHLVKGPLRTRLNDTLGSGRYRYIEERLQAGEPLYAIGEFRTRAGGRAGLDLNAAQGEVVREWKGDYASLLRRFDNNRDGQLGEAEWDRVRLAARLEAEERHRLASARPAELRLVRPYEALPFVLSSHGQEVLARRYRWQAIGGAALCAAGAWLLSAQWVFLF